jgi:hypothetical protein
MRTGMLLPNLMDQNVSPCREEKATKDAHDGATELRLECSNGDGSNEFATPQILGKLEPPPPKPY